MKKNIPINTFIKSYSHYLVLGLVMIGILARIVSLEKINDDLTNYLFPWYEYISTNGILKSLGEKFSNYSPAYTYLLAIVTTLPLKKIIAIKSISILMDIINCIVIYKIVKLKYPVGSIPLIASSIFWCLPTVIFNSAYWGQCDGIYTGFLLLTLYMFMLGRYLIGIVYFSVAIAFKLQAIFMAPIILVLYLKFFLKLEKNKFNSEFKFWYFLLVPIIYILISLPTVFLGRDLFEVLSVYFHQTETYKYLNINAPNLYFLVSNDHYYSLSKYGLISAVVCFFIWIIYTTKLKFIQYSNQLAISTLASVSLAPMLLPMMHERYFYPTDVISLLVAFYIPRFWFLPIIFQLTSFLAYSRWLLGFWHNKVFAVASILNFLIVIYIIKSQKTNNHLS